MSETATVIGCFEKNASEAVRVTLDEFNGTNVIDCRIYARLEIGAEPRPTRKGICIRVAQLPRLIELLTDAAVEARRRGLLPEAGQ